MVKIVNFDTSWDSFYRNLELFAETKYSMYTEKVSKQEQTLA